MFEIKDSKVNMATSANVVGTFSGEAGEDVMLWIQQVRFAGEVYGAPDVEIKKMILLNLRGAAQAWTSSTFGNRTLETHTV